MLNLSRFLLALIATAALAVGSSAYVVIDNFEVGSQVFDSSAQGSSGRKERATGVVSDDQSGGKKADEDFLFLPPDSGTRTGTRTGTSNKRGRNSNSRSANDMLLYHLSKRGSSSNGLAGRGSRSRRSGTGSGNSKQRGSNRGGREAEMVQTMVTISGNGNDYGRDGQSPQPPSDFHMNLSLYDSGSAASVSGSSGGAGVGATATTDTTGLPGDTTGLPGDIVAGSDPGAIISGSPEPAALAVWAVIGCCGYGFVRCRRRWISSSHCLLSPFSAARVG